MGRSPSVFPAPPSFFLFFFLLGSWTAAQCHDREAQDTTASQERKRKYPRKIHSRGSEQAGIPSPCAHQAASIARTRELGTPDKCPRAQSPMTLLTILSLPSSPRKSEGAALSLLGPLPCRILPVDSSWPRAPCQQPFARLSDVVKLPMPTVTLQ